MTSDLDIYRCAPWGSASIARMQESEPRGELMLDKDNIEGPQVWLRKLVAAVDQDSECRNRAGEGEITASPSAADAIGRPAAGV